MKETPKAAAAYDEYAAMGPTRSLAKLHEQLRQSQGKVRAGLDTLEHWSSVHNWQVRVREHDAALAAEKEARKLAALDEMNERQAALGVEQTQAALTQIAALMSDGRFGSQAAVMLLKLAIETERTARGAPASVQRQEVSLSGELAITDARTTLAARLAALTGQTPASGVINDPA